MTDDQLFIAECQIWERNMFGRTFTDWAKFLDEMTDAFSCSNLPMAPQWLGHQNEAVTLEWYGHLLRGMP